MNSRSNEASSSFNVGDKVTWMHAGKRGRGITFTTRKGKVLAIYPNNVTVQYRGTIIHVLRDKVRKEGETTELTEFLQEVI
jgi:hypothetical protein